MAEETAVEEQPDVQDQPPAPGLAEQAAAMRAEAQSTPEGQRGLAAGRAAAAQPKEPPPWEDVADDFQAAFPNQDQSLLRRRYDQALELRRVRRADDDRGDSFLERFGRGVAQHMPLSQYVFPAADQAHYHQAMERYQQGDATPEDHGTIAAYERHQREDAEATSTPAGAAGQTLLRMPAVAAEWLGGGAVLKAAGIGAPGLLSGASYAGAGAVARTAGRLAATELVNPAFWVPEWQEANRRDGRNLFDPRGLPTGLGLGLMNTAVLGSLGEFFNGTGGSGLAGVLGRTSGRVGVGLLEMEAANNVQHLMGLRTDYGSLTELWRGGDDATKHLIGDVITLTAFSLLHAAGERHGDTRQGREPGQVSGEGAPEGPQGGPESPGGEPRRGWSAEQVQNHPVVRAFADAMNSLKRAGMSENAASNAVGSIANEYKRAVANNPNITRADLRRMFENTGNTALRDFGLAIADSHPETSRASQPQGEQQPGQAAQEQPSGQPSEQPSPEGQQPARLQPPEPTARERATALEDAHRQALSAELDARRAMQRANSGQIGSMNPKEAKTAYQQAVRHRQELSRQLDETGHEAAMEDIRRAAEPPASPETSAAATGGQNVPEWQSAAAQGQPEPPVRPENQTWANQGTEFRDVPGRPIEFTGSDGRTYSIEHETKAPDKGRPGDLGYHSIRVRDANGDFVGGASAWNRSDGKIELHFYKKESAPKDLKGLGAVMHDYADRTIADIVHPRRTEFGLHTSEAGNAVWRRNAKLARERNEPQGVPGNVRAGEAGQSGAGSEGARGQAVRPGSAPVEGAARRSPEWQARYNKEIAKGASPKEATRRATLYAPEQRQNPAVRESMDRAVAHMNRANLDSETQGQAIARFRELMAADPKAAQAFAEGIASGKIDPKEIGGGQRTEDRGQPESDVTVTQNTRAGAGPGQVVESNRVENMRRRQQGLAPIKTPKQPSVEPRVPEKLSQAERAAEEHFANTRYEDVPKELQFRVEQIVKALKGTHDAEAIRQSARSAYAAGGEEGLHELLQVQEGRLKPGEATPEKLSLAKENLYQANKEFQDEVERAYRYAQRSALIEASVRRRLAERVQKADEDAAAFAPRAGDAGPAQQPAAPAGAAQVPDARVADSQAGAPAPAERGQAAREQLARARAAKPRTLLSILKRAGGLSKESAKAHGFDVAEMEENIPSIFKNHEGRKGTMEIVEAAEHLINEGHMVGEKGSPYLADQLRQKILDHAVSLEQNIDAALSREHAQYLREQHDAARNHPTAEVAKAVREGTALGEAEGRESEAGEVHPDDEEALKAAGGRGDANEPAGAEPGDFNPADFGGWSESAKRAVNDWLRDESGHLLFPGRDAIKDWLATKLDQVKKVGRYLADNYRELAGQMFPKLTRLDRASGEAFARFITAPSYARLAAPVYLDKVMGPKASMADRLLAGAVLTERRLRYMRHAYILAGDMKAANKVTSIIGQEGSPLQSLADYQRALQSPLVDGMMRRWNNDFVPVMEDNFRRAQGLDDTDPINSPTQVPGSPVNLRAVRPGEENEPGAVFTGPGKRGNLKNVRLNKFAFAEQATGTADGYHLDIGAIIENSLSNGFTNAAKAEWARTMVASGAARWGIPGVRLEGATEVPWVKPPPGTQENTKGQTSLYVDADAYNEIRQGLQVDKPLHVPAVTDLAPVFNAATLASTVEAAYHGKNQLTFLMKPGVRPHDFVRNVLGVLKKAPWVGERIMELARIGAHKPPGFEANNLLLGRADPRAWLSKFLDVTRNVMELTADDAFSRLARSGLVENTETNRRNWINQLGQYNRAAQNKIVLALRDSGLGPFATAGTNYFIQKLRALSMYGGVKGTSWAGSARMRGETLAKTIALVGLAIPIINKLLWDRWDGDDNTPFASIKIGTDAQGRTRSIGLGNLIGFVGGLRETGVLAMIEGSRRGTPPGQMVDRAVENIVGSALHPAEGPIVQFAHTAITGTNALGMKLADKVPPGESHAVSNLVSAFRQANPIVAAATGAGHPGHRGETIPWGERGGQLLGPFGYQYRGGFVNDVQRRFNELSPQRTAASQQGIPFRDEREYQIMSYAHQRIVEIDQRLRGMARASGRLVPAPRPEGEDRDRLLGMQRDIAKMALEAAKK